MAKIYRIQLTPAIINSAKNGKIIETEILKFESKDELIEFINDPEKFVRKIGLYTEEMEFRGFTKPLTITIDDVLQDDFKINKVEVLHESTCQLAWAF